MNGTDATTGKPLIGIDHLRQSIRDILCTPMGSRVMLRTYGCGLFDLVDAPMNRSTILSIISAVATALKNWEPRIKVSKVALNSAVAGQLVLDLTGIYLPDGTPIKIDGIVIK
jgi:Bacteriophage baseplate protein W